MAPAPTAASERTTDETLNCNGGPEREAVAGLQCAHIRSVRHGRGILKIGPHCMPVMDLQLDPNMDDANHNEFVHIFVS
jgi:hypothetical protein